MTEAMQEFREARGAVPGAVSGLRLTVDYGDFEAEAAAIREEYGLLELESSGVIMTRGADAASFLGGLTTNDVEKMALGAASPGLLCANKGKIIQPLEVVRMQAGQFLVVTAPGAQDAVAAHLEAYHIREAVEFGRVELVRLDLIGPQAGAALEAMGHSTAQPMGAFNEAPVLTLSLPLGALPRVMVLLPRAVASAWADALLEKAPLGRPAGFSAFEEERIRAGYPLFGVDYGADHLPAEAALYDRISFDKGCYVGQEIHARLHYRGHVNRKLMAVTVPSDTAPQPGVELFAGAEPQPGAELYAGDKPAGRLTSLCRLPLDRKRRGIAMLRYEQATAGEPLSLAPGAAPAVQLAPLATDLGSAGQ